MHRTFFSFAIILIVTLLANIESDGQIRTSRSILSRQVTLVVEDVDPDLVLKTLSNRGRISVGFYRIRPNHNSLEPKISLKVVGGSVRDVLDQFVKADSRYTWVEIDGVLNIFPVEVPVLLLSTVDTVDFEDLKLDDVGSILLSLPETSATLRAVGLSNAILRTRYGQATPNKNISLLMKCSSIQDVLNKILRDKHARYWTVEYGGDNFEYLSILFN